MAHRPVGHNGLYRDDAPVAIPHRAKFGVPIGLERPAAFDRVDLEILKRRPLCLIVPRRIPVTLSVRADDGDDHSLGATELVHSDRSHSRVRGLPLQEKAYADGWTMYRMGVARAVWNRNGGNALWK